MTAPTAIGPSHRDNAFDVVRLFAVTTVLVSHSWSLTGRHDPLVGLLDNQVGTIGVHMFFGISGFLITASWMTDPRLREFAIKRFLRLVPALMVCALATAFVLGPLVTTRPLGSYFSDATPYLYVIRELPLNTFNTFLPGVFETNPYPNYVNGSLWTMPLEACCYAAVAAAGAIGLLHRRWLLVALLVVAVVAVWVGDPPDDPLGTANVTGLDSVVNALRVCTAFLTGSVVWFMRDRLPGNPWPIVALTLVLIALPLPSGMHTAIVVLLVPLAALGVGRCPPGWAQIAVKPGDVSYGVYIYAYPLQQLIVFLDPTIRPVILLALAAPGAYLLGLLSWQLVEKPSQDLRRRLLRAPQGVRPQHPRPRPACASERLRPGS